MTEDSQRLSPSVAFVTPSYRLDRDRCALLNRSLEACAPSFEHWIVVDRGDLPLFRALQSNTTHVVTKEEVLPVWVHRVDTLRIGLRSNAWLQARGRPIRGWLLQQLVKLAVVESLDTDIVLHADSDVVFLRPFSVASVTNGAGDIRLYARPGTVDESLPNHVRWHRSAEELLGLEQTDLPLPDFISSLVAWKRENAVALLRHIERTTGRHWLRALASAWDVSEYTLYGRFAEDVLGMTSGQFVSEAPLCVDYYKRVPLGVPELTSFLDRARSDAIAASLTSKAGMDPRDYVAVLERFWAEPVARRQPVDRQPRANRRGRATDEAGSSRSSPDGAWPATASHIGGPRREGVIRRAGRAGMAAVAFALVALMMLILGLGVD